MICYCIRTGSLTAAQRRQLVFSLLSDYFNVIVDAHNFLYNTYRKPYIDTGTGAIRSFNYAHTKNYLALILGEKEAVGIDAEEIRKPRKGLQSLTELLSLEERRYLAGFHSEEFHNETLKIWVQKEAIGKALGVGIQYDMASITVSGAAHGCFRRVILREESFCVGVLITADCYIGIAWQTLVLGKRHSKKE